MPNSYETRTVYIDGSNSNPDQVNIQYPYMDGQVGQTYNLNDRTYQFVQVDSGSAALAANAANDVLFWKDRSKYIVTRDSRQSNGARNNVAGILRNAATSGYYVWALQRGDAINVKSAGGGAEGDNVIANSGTSADVTVVTAGTAVTYMSLGKARAATSNNLISVDLDIPSAP